MTGWHAERMPGRSARAVIAVTLLALLLVAAVPVALLAAVVMMLLGHVVGGLALFGGSVLAAAAVVALAGVSGMRHLRKLISAGSFRVVRLRALASCLTRLGAPGGRPVAAPSSMFAARGCGQGPDLMTTAHRRGGPPKQCRSRGSMGCDASSGLTGSGARVPSRQVRCRRGAATPRRRVLVFGLLLLPRRS